MGSQHVGSGHDHPPSNGGPLEPVYLNNSPELSLIRTYAQRRHPEEKLSLPTTPPAEEQPRRKKKSFKKHLSQWWSCVVAPKEGPDEGQDRTFGRKGDEKEKETQASKRVGELTTKLMDIADVVFVPPEIEPDSEDGEIERLAGELLRQHGDAMQQKFVCDQILRNLLMDYSQFSSLMSTVFRMMGIETPDHGTQGPTESTSRTNMAVTCEVASRLSAMDTLPMSRVLGFGARYLKENCSLEAEMNVEEDTDGEKEVE